MAAIEPGASTESSVKIVMTLLARDEADILDAQLRYHLENGVDFVVATDHGSTDGTTEILRRHEREGHLRLLRSSGEITQSEWVTRMARLASSEHGADWVINADADEFWWPQQGTFRDALAAVPARFGVVRSLVRHFVLRPEGRDPFYERLIVRHVAADSGRSFLRGNVKVAHRAAPGVVVPRGNHDVRGGGLVLLRAWFPFEVLHFPIRSLSQFSRKYTRRGDTPTALVAAVRREIATRGAEAAFAQLVVTDETLDSRLRSGELAVDVRVRDALRAGDGWTKAADDGLEPESPVAAKRALISDIAAFMETDSAQMLHTRVDLLERRVRAREARTNHAGRALRHVTAAVWGR